MRITSLISKILNVKGMVIKSINIEPYEDGEEGIIIDTEPTKRNKCRCGICNRKSQSYDEGRGVRLWRSVDLGSMRVYIRGRAPRVRCERHGVIVAKVPWARHGSWFTREFEDMMTWLSLHCTQSVVSELMRVQWNTVGPVARRVYDEIKDSIGSPFDNLRQIGIDETSYKKGHKYITVVVNHETGDLIWAGKGYGKEVLEGFFKQMTEAQCANITHVSADGARWIADCVITLS
jgi:transposase